MRSLCLDLYPILVGVICFHHNNGFLAFYNFDNSSLLDMYLVNTFSVACSFVQMLVPFVTHNIFSFMRCLLSVVCLSACGICVLFRMSFLWLRGQDYSLLLFYQIQCVWLYVEVLDPFVIEFCAQWSIYIFTHSSTSSYPVWIAPFVKHAVFFSPEHISGFFGKNQVPANIWIYVLVFTLIPLVSKPAFMPMPCCFCYYSSII